MKLSCIIRALIGAGASSEMILCAVEADEKNREEEAARIREAARQRKALSRKNKLLDSNDLVTNVTVTSRDTKKGKEATKSDFSLPEWIPTDAWRGWMEMRKKKGSPPTTRAIELSIKELDRLRSAGIDPGSVLEQSIQRGWTGLFPPKVNWQEGRKEPPKKPARLLAGSKEALEAYGHSAD